MISTPLTGARHESRRYRDLISRIENLSGIEEMSLLAHSPKDAGLLAMMVASYNDESADKHTFSVSGLLGLLPEWVELGRLWEAKLVEHNLPEFHAVNCEQRLPPFESYERETRSMFQREFYGLITKVNLWGFCTAVWNVAYEDRRAEFERHRVKSEGDFTDPYFLAFQHNIELMCLTLDKGGFARNEPIAFVFDQQNEFGGRAKQLYDSLKRSEGGRITYRHRLGSLSFDSRFCQLQLQAADVWAYESRKWISDVKIAQHLDGRRWQFEILQETKRNRIFGFPTDNLDRLILSMREDLRQ